MKTIRTKVYQFSELSNEAKKKAIEWFLYGNDDSERAWENTKEDANQIGLKIISIDGNRANKGEFILAANEVAQNILNNHGDICDTHKTAEEFMKEWQPVFYKYMETEDGEAKLMEIEDCFLRSLLEDYRIMYNNDVDYYNSDSYAIEFIQLNEYYFTKDGNPFHS